MDGKRTVDRMVLPRKASGHVLRENMNKREDEKSVSFCSRIGCSAKVSHTKGTRMDNNTKLGSSSHLEPRVDLDTSHSRPSSNSGPSPSRSMVSQDGLSRYNINGIAEVLLALERIEHDQDLTYERLAFLETSLFSSGMIRFYDEHRDMRLDIDNMSYEELLALGDKMGTVSTALSEEALNKDDIKCNEEYVDGDEVGSMPCEHMFHVSCVQQWLRMKNWCPICKTSAEEKSL
uniref:RING-type E3 ubiquitin transferase n=1 Tax=Brassica oleracea var. oleracea TaxID=109376 RepID=A0A0D3AIG4_BRAOL